jgi:glycosyltransferase involved in cell wall biosynthesis
MYDGSAFIDYKTVIVRAPVRILHVTPYFADAWAYGGIPRLAHSLTRGLARRGHQVTVCTTDACDESSRLPALSSRTSDGVELRVFPNLSNHLAYHLQLFLPRGLEHYLRHHAGTFDVAHLHACRNVPGAMAARHLRRAGVPYVIAPNGTAPRIERRLLAKRAFDILAGQGILAGASRILAVSDAERRQLCALDVAPSVIRVIPNPVDLDEFTSPVTRGAFRRRVELPSGPVVLFLGKLTPRKRLDVLARAFAQLRHSDAWLVIAGNDMGAGARTRSIVRALGLETRTVFTGLLRGRERLEALADADVLVYPSEHEIFGLVPLESLLSGTPVIVADDSGCGEVVRATGGGAVVPLGDADALARAIEGVLEDPSGWRAAAADARVRVRATYGADIVCAQLGQLYGEMVAGA